MKKGISVKDLVLHAPALKRAMALDPRGGFFRQKEIYKIFAKLAESHEHVAYFLAFCEKFGYSSLQASLISCAYLFRVMLSHIREKKTEYMQIENADEKHPHAKQ